MIWIKNIVMEFYESGLLTMKHLLWPTSTVQWWSNTVKDTFQCKACLVCHSNDLQQISHFMLSTHLCDCPVCDVTTTVHQLYPSEHNRLYWVPHTSSRYKQKLILWKEMQLSNFISHAELSFTIVSRKVKEC